VHPDFVLVTGKGRTAIISRPEDDWFTIVDLLLMTHLEVPGNAARVAEQL
jgi:PHD/YefM family antitoxin component YafN of YafNO toxin-antitoxin module